MLLLYLPGLDFILLDQPICRPHLRRLYFRVWDTADLPPLHPSVPDRRHTCRESMTRSRRPLVVGLAFGPFEPLFAELLQARVTVFHQHRIDKHIGIYDAFGVVVKTDTVVCLERSAHAVYA